MSILKVWEILEQKLQRKDKPLIYQFFCLSCYKYSDVIAGQKEYICKHCNKVRTY